MFRCGIPNRVQKVVGYGIFHKFYTKIKAGNQSLYFYSFIKECEFVIFKNNHTGLIQEEGDATKQEMGKHFIRSDVTL